MNHDRLLGLVGPAVLALSGSMRATQRDDLAALDTAPSAAGRVVLLGDSITRQGPWPELLPGLPVANRGVDADTTRGLRGRLDRVPPRPRAFSLLVGTNDLVASPRERRVEAVAHRTREIVATLRAAHPHVPVVLNAVTPRTELFAPRIRDLNARYRRIADELGASYLDTWPALADDTGALRPEFTRDHLHLTVPGYLAWAPDLRALLASVLADDGRDGGPGSAPA